MANWVSVLGKWFPRKEYAVNPEAPDGEEIYEGFDRDATRILKENNVDHLGDDYKRHGDTLNIARQLGYKNVDDYLKDMVGFDPVEAEKKAKALIENPVSYKKRPVPSNPVQVQSGGDDFTGGGNSVKGGFGDSTSAVEEAVAKTYKKGK